MIDKLNFMYEFAEDNNISISNFKFYNNTKSMCMNTDKKFHICIDYMKIKSKNEELCILAEEIGHYHVGITPTDPTSNSYFNKLVRSRNEYRAMKKAIESIIDMLELKNIIDSGTILYVDELAEKFNVTSEFMNNALLVYGYKV